jgi:hypothetical protein
MELIDKQKLLESLHGRRKDKRRWENTVNVELAREISEIIDDLESGTFDDHSTQEEIAKLKEERDEARKIAKQSGDYAEQRNKWQARALQAEQRWKEEHEAHTKRIAQFSDEKSARIQAEQERDALLEGAERCAESERYEP